MIKVMRAPETTEGTLMRALLWNKKMYFEMKVMKDAPAPTPVPLFVRCDASCRPVTPSPCLRVFLGSPLVGECGEGFE